MQINWASEPILDLTSEVESPRYHASIQVKSLKKNVPAYIVWKSMETYESEEEAELIGYKTLAEKIGTELSGIRMFLGC
jgi:hypothetical protein